jgi:hypothetical protein
MGVVEVVVDSTGNVLVVVTGEVVVVVVPN